MGASPESITPVFPKQYGQGLWIPALALRSAGMTPPARQILPGGGASCLPQGLVDRIKPLI